jgi:hypothetical protein
MAKNINPNPEERQRIVDDVLHHLHTSIGEPTLSPVDQLMARTKAAIDRVNSAWLFRTKVTPSLLFNKDEQVRQLSDLFLNEFRTWTKEELLFVCVMLHTNVVMQQM